MQEFVGDLHPCSCRIPMYVDSSTIDPFRLCGRYSTQLRRPSSNASFDGLLFPVYLLICLNFLSIFGHLLFSSRRAAQSVCAFFLTLGLLYMWVTLASSFPFLHSFLLSDASVRISCGSMIRRFPVCEFSAEFFFARIRSWFSASDGFSFSLLPLSSCSIEFPCPSILGPVSVLTWSETEFSIFAFSDGLHSILRAL